MKIITAMVEGGKVTGIYLKPDNTLNRKRLPFFVPEEPAEVAARVGVAVTIEKVGKTIRREFAERYYEKAALAVEVTDMAALKRAREEGEPWTMAVGMDGSLTLSEFREIEDMTTAEVETDGEKWGECEVARLLERVPEVMTKVSRVMTLKTGDIVVVIDGERERRLRIGETIVVSSKEGKEIELRIK